MPKLKLEVEALAVESFETRAAEPPRGTVLGHSAFTCETGDGYTCDGVQTCNEIHTCQPVHTCIDASCDGVCTSARCVTDPSCDRWYSCVCEPGTYPHLC